MVAWLKSVKAELRAVLCGWVAVALVVPALLGTASGHALTPAEELFSQIKHAACLQTGQPEPDQDQHKVHDHDCCLPNLSAGQAVIAASTSTDPALSQLHVAQIESVAWATPAHHPHTFQLGIPRGPPSLPA